MDEMSTRATLLLITVIATSKIGPSQSWSTRMQMNTVKPQTFDVSLERTFDDLLTVTLSGGYDHLEPQTIELALGRFEFQNKLRDDNGFDYWEQHSPITRCFTLSRNHEGCVIPKSMGSCSSNCCKAVCLKLANRENKLQSDTLKLSIEIEILCCKTQTSGPNCGPLNNTSEGGKVFHCPIRYSLSLHTAEMDINRGDKAILDHTGKRTNYRSRLNLHYRKIESKGLILDTYNNMVRNDPLRSSDLYHYYVEHTIDDRLIGSFGFGNKTIDWWGAFNKARKEFNPADIPLKCSSVQSISKKYHFVCPVLHQISDGRCTSVNFELSYTIISCDEAHRDDGWQCYRRRLLVAKHLLKLELHLGYRITTDGGSTVSAAKPLDPRYELYNRMLKPGANINMIFCPYIYYADHYALIFRRTRRHFIIQLWYQHTCKASVSTATMVLLLHSENETQIMFKEQSRKMCMDIIASRENIVCKDCNRVCLFLYDMKSGPSRNDAISFNWKIEFISGDSKIGTKTCRPLIRDTVTSMFIGDEVIA